MKQIPRTLDNSREYEKTSSDVYYTNEVQIKSAHSHLCLFALGTANSSLQLKNCSDDPKQLWRVSNDGRIRHYDASGMDEDDELCITVANKKKPVSVKPCGDKPNSKTNQFSYDMFDSTIGFKNNGKLTH